MGQFQDPLLKSPKAGRSPSILPITPMLKQLSILTVYDWKISLMEYRMLHRKLWALVNRLLTKLNFLMKVCIGIIHTFVKTMRKSLDFTEIIGSYQVI